MKKLNTRKTKFTALILSTLLITGLGTANAAVVAPPNYPMYDTGNINNESKWNIMNGHDPEIYKEGNYYYVFSTDYKVGATAKPGIQVRKSKDLINWEWVGYAFNGMPEAAKQWTGENLLWAPEIVKMGNTFYLYYCASKFGTRDSYIGVATSNSITGPWTDKGEVFKTKNTDKNHVNAIDPNIVFDASGQPWLVYGSFFGGIYVNKVDSNTGKLVTYGEGTLIACRNNNVSAAVEGPNMVYNPNTKMYYLFTSYDSLNGTYNVRVGRSKSVTGPFVDYNGNKLTDITLSPQTEVGTKILGSYSFNNSDGWVAPGHNSILKDNNNWYMLHHARGGADTNWAYLHARKLLWTNDGWPVVSPERYTGETENTLASTAIAGTWESIVLDRGTTKKITSSSVKLLPDGKIGTSDSKNYWTFTAPNTLKLYWYASGQTAGDYWIDTVKVIEGWDFENNKKTYVYTGLNQSGTAVWGKKSQ